MKKIAIFLFFITISHLQAQTENIDAVAKQVETDLSTWANSFDNFKMSDFIEVDSIAEFEKIKGEKIKNVKRFLSVYEPIITYSKDKTKFIDIYSSQLNLEEKNGKYFTNIDIGQVVFLCDIKTKYWKRIFYAESSRWIDEIVWIDANKFILAGIEKEENDQNVPVIYVGDTKQQSFRILVNTNSLCKQKNPGYISGKLKRIKIENE